MKQVFFTLLLLVLSLNTLIAQKVSLKKQGCTDVIFYRNGGSMCEIDYPGAKSEDITVEGTGVQSVRMTGNVFIITPENSLAGNTITLKIKAKGKKAVSMDFPLKSLGKPSLSVNGRDIPYQMSLNELEYASFYLSAAFKVDNGCPEVYSGHVVSYELAVGPKTYTQSNINSGEIKNMIKKNGKGSLLYTNIKVMIEGKEVKVPNQKVTVVK